MTSKITIFTRDHKRSGNTNEYQKDTPIEYIQKYVFSAQNDPIKVSVTKGTTDWFPNQICLGVVSKTDENLMDAPDIEFEVDKSGSKKDTSFTQLDEFKVKGVRVTFQLEELCAHPVVEIFITYRRAGNKAHVRDVITRRIKFSHNIVMDGPVTGVTADETVVKAGIVKPDEEEPKEKVSSHSTHRPPLKEEECSSVRIFHKNYNICTISSPLLSAKGVHTDEEYDPEQYIACPRTVSKLENLFKDLSPDDAPLFVKFAPTALYLLYSEHRILAALSVVAGPCYSRFIAAYNGSIYFIGHSLPEDVRTEERYWEIEKNEVEIDSEEEDVSSSEGSAYSGEGGEDDDIDDEEDPLDEGEGIEDEAGDEIQEEESGEEDAIEDFDDTSSSSSKKRKRATVKDLIDDEASEDVDIDESLPKKRKKEEIEGDEVMELE